MTGSALRKNSVELETSTHWHIPRAQSSKALSRALKDEEHRKGKRDSEKKNQGRLPTTERVPSVLYINKMCKMWLIQRGTMADTVGFLPNIYSHLPGRAWICSNTTSFKWLSSMSKFRLVLANHSDFMPVTSLEGTYDPKSGHRKSTGGLWER